MGFTIEWVSEITFEPCVGWPEVGGNTLPNDFEKTPVVNGHFQSSLTGDMKLDNFTGYITMEYGQIGGMCGNDECRSEKTSVVEMNRQKVLAAYEKYKNNA